MTVAMANNDLWNDRAAHGWRGIVEKALKGRAFDDALVSRSADGLLIEPLYPAAPEEPAPPLSRHRPWRLAQRIDHPDPREASRLALEDLEGGAREMVLVLSGSPTARGFGVDASTVEALELALSGIKLDLIGLRLETAPFDGRAVAQNMLELIARRGDRGDEPFDRLRSRSGLRHGAMRRAAARLAGPCGALHGDRENA